jgi:hypothetical protein
MSDTGQKNSWLFQLSVWVAILFPKWLLLGLIVYIQSNDLASGTDRQLLYIVLSLFIILMLLWLLVLLWQKFGSSLGRPVRWLLFFLFYPAAMISTFIFRMNKLKVQEGFLAFQNRLFMTSNRLDGQSRLLLLLPHCLQFHDCKIRITRDVNSCEECGDCDICNLKDIGKRFELKIGIANGGTLARKIVHDLNPDAIIACHRDLTDGVRESWKYPVFAILNERPFGPCYDTRVDTDKVESIINLITEHKIQR